MNEKVKMGKDALVFSIMTLVTALSWVGFAIYQAATKSEITNVPPEHLIPLDPTLETKVVEEIKSGITFSQSELESIPIPSPESTVTPTPTQGSTITPTPTQETTITPTPAQEATGGAVQQNP